MRKAMWVALMTMLLVGWGAIGISTAQAPKPEAATAPKPAPPKPAAKLVMPKVELERVEIASYFPYAPPPARVPLVLAFIFNVTNPNGFPVRLEDMKFTYGFEAKPGEYFNLNTPTVHETASVPGKTTNQLRVVSVLDSAIVPATLSVTSGFRVQALDLKPAEVVKTWWEQIGDFPFGIRVSEGVANFSSARGGALVPFEAKFPKK
jgi:hypothetical protein